ncbi:hypothetical protein NIES4102_23610 [Chondrocystis sp. NIES-4102]|nr:hypothetical protein NIES4102_23610 [Chondrocystis sp. NIES-4102]
MSVLQRLIVMYIQKIPNIFIRVIEKLVSFHSSKIGFLYEVALYKV